MHTTLITGINGFVGQHLAREMHAANCEVWGIGLNDTVDDAIASVVTNYYSCDLTDAKAVAKLPLDKVDSIINLAGLANVGASFANPDLYHRVNVGVFANLAARLLELDAPTARILAISTGAVYDSDGQPPFDESAAFVPSKNRNPYVESKLLMESAVSDFREKGLDAVILRPFNHIGPGQLGGFLLPDLAAQIDQAVASKSPNISVGNLDNQRDFTDVRDVVRAYRLVALEDKKGLRHSTYNVASGQPTAGRKLLDLLLEYKNQVGLEVVINKDLLRPNDPPVLVGDHGALTSDTGWQPEITIEQTVRDFVAWSKDII